MYWSYSHKEAHKYVYLKITPQLCVETEGKMENSNYFESSD